jgi:Phospholipase D Active site motif
MAADHAEAKTLVVDGEWSAIGSMNFDNRSMARSGGLPPPVVA